jgi:hypothetical protein
VEEATPEIADPGASKKPSSRPKPSLGGTKNKLGFNRSLSRATVGDAIGDACWRKGHAAGIRRKAPAEGKIRADFSLNELLQLS